MNYIDYTQLSTFLSCEWKWYDRYVQGWRPNYGDRQRDDVMCLGGLVHAGLEEYRTNGSPTITTSVVEELSPTRETLSNAQYLLAHYIKQRPEEKFRLSRCEEPLLFPIAYEGWSGLAKLDYYFHIDEPTYVYTGVNGEQTLLPVGWYIREYKTRESSSSRGNYLKQWNTRKQADFQMLALREKVGETPQGMLVSVIEKPREYVPKRKCQGPCAKQYELSSYMAIEGGGYKCSWCGFVSEFKDPVRAAGFVGDPTIYDIFVSRTEDQLQEAQLLAGNVAERMDRIIKGGVIVPNEDNCVNSIFGECEFYTPHILGAEMGSSGFVKEDTLRYMGVGNG